MDRFIFIVLLIFFINSCDGSSNNEPSVITLEIFNTYANYIDIKAEILKIGGTQIVDHGFVWSETADPTISNSSISLGVISVENQFESRVQTLEPNTTYYFNSYIKTADNEVIYGEEISTKTLPENFWIQKSDFENGILAGAAAFVINDTLYVGSGVGRDYTNIFYKYYLLSDSWDLIANLPSSARINSISFTINGYGYVGLGSNCTGSGLCSINYFNDLWRYDPASNSWSKMMDFPGSPRDKSTVFVIGDKAYVTGGGTVDESRVMWEYDSANDLWTRKADYPGLGLNGKVAFSFNGFGYVGLGFNDRESFKDIWKYDSSTNIWSTLEDFPGDERTESVFFQTKISGYVLGGAKFERHQPDIYLNDFWHFNPLSETWGKINTEYPGTGRVHMNAGVIDGRIFVGVGSTFISHSNDDRAMDIWEYIPIIYNE